MLTEFPIQNPDEVNLNDYLLELRRVPESILRAFADSGWTYAVDFQHLASLTPAVWHELYGRRGLR